MKDDNQKDYNLVKRMRYGTRKPLKDGIKNNRLITWPVAGFCLGLWMGLLYSIEFAMIGMVAALIATYLFKKPMSVFTDANYLVLVFPVIVILLQSFPIMFPETGECCDLQLLGSGYIAAWSIVPAIFFIVLLVHSKPIR